MFYGQEPMKRGLKRMNRGLERMVRFENPVFGGAERMIWRREPVICGLGRIPGRLEHWRRRQKHEKRALKHKAGRLEHWERWLGRGCGEARPSPSGLSVFFFEGGNSAPPHAVKQQRF